MTSSKCRVEVISIYNDLQKFFFFFPFDGNFSYDFD